LRGKGRPKTKHLSAEDSAQVIAHVGRREVEIHKWLGVVQSVMPDLNRSQVSQEGNASDDSVKAVAGYVRSPVRHFVGDEVQRDSQEERWGESGAEHHGEGGVVNRKQEGENVPGGNDFEECGRVVGLKAVAVEDAVVKGVARVGATAVHREPVPDVFEKIRVESAGERKQERSDRDLGRSQEGELQSESGDVGTGCPSDGDG
jgi:hypothetical protein